MAFPWMERSFYNRSIHKYINRFLSFTFPMFLKGNPESLKKVF